MLCFKFNITGSKKCRKAIPYLLLKNTIHQMPFLVAASSGAGALKLADIGFPFGLAGQGGQSGHITDEVEPVDSVHDHEETAAMPVYLHIQDADLTLAFDDLRPHMGMGRHIFGDFFFVVDKLQILTVTLHGFSFTNIPV